MKLLEDIDELLAYLEDTAHGEEGKRITEIRGRIQTELSNSHKHSISGKRPDFEAMIKALEQMPDDKLDKLIKQVEVACASGAVDTVAERGNVRNSVGAATSERKILLPMDIGLCRL